MMHMQDISAASAASATRFQWPHAAVPIRVTSPMSTISRMLIKFAVTNAPILITGESGTGKEVTAQAIHAASRRADKVFVALNCAALPSELIASELFGYEKGAFTGAVMRKIGQIEHAHGGTLFLDEIGDMPIDLQSHLLRFLQEGCISRVGGRGEAIRVDVRIIAATNVDLSAAMRDGRFREDLFFRLNVLSLHMPPLRERVGDLEPLVYRFLAESAEQVGRRVHGIAPEAMAMLMAHDWPGNVRELKSAIFRSVVMSNGNVVQAEDISLTKLARVNAKPPQTEQPLPSVEFRNPPVASISREALITCLMSNRQNVAATARALQVSRVTLYRMLRRFDVPLTRASDASEVLEPALACEPADAQQTSYGCVCRAPGRPRSDALQPNANSAGKVAARGSGSLRQSGLVDEAW